MRRISAVFVAFVMLAVCIAPVAAAGSQTWYLKDTGASGFSFPSEHAYDKLMDKTTPSEETVQSITLSKSQRVWWYVNEAAGQDLSFPSGDWNVAFWVKALNSEDNNKIVYVRLHNITLQGDNTQIWEKQPKTSSAGSIEMISTLKENANTFVVNYGGRIAIEIYWVSTATGDLVVYYNSTIHPSSVTLPAGSPNYPTPELSTLVLFATGLTALLGSAALKKRRK
ncbi:MAG: hypothetical protein CVT48_01755 [Thermoplasmata archaeon HGW-Thermoplasmata-1]|nr:MAG: hypothetical protein CVT48_01755 [Thermoplasmata archaeon HGW-Thermoplasmata-1]